MPAAIRINGQTIMTSLKPGKGVRHIELLRGFQRSHGFTDDETDALIAAGAIEFGTVHPVTPDVFMPDEVRDDVYTSIDKMIRINGDAT